MRLFRRYEGIRKNLLDGHAVMTNFNLYTLREIDNRRGLNDPLR
jgi:hypothetical protein